MCILYSDMKIERCMFPSPSYLCPSSTAPLNCTFPIFPKPQSLLSSTSTSFAFSFPSSVKTTLFRSVSHPLTSAPPSSFPSSAIHSLPSCSFLYPPLPHLHLSILNSCSRESPEVQMIGNINWWWWWC